VSYLAEPLGEHHDLAQFDCGNGELNEWVRLHARTATGQGTRTYVVIDDLQAVVGYFAIAPHTIDREVLPRSQGRGAPRQIPAVLLAKLALDRRLQGQGLGSELLVAALTTIVRAAQRVGGKMVVVDAIDDTAARFYLHHEFIPIPDNPRRLVRKLSTIARALDLPWP
jgi:GNAT superfamily N-acetyltransferase